MAPLLIDLPQMIDLALGTPDCGAVNFNVLQALLHIMVRRLPLDEYRVEFRGEDGQKIEGLIPYIEPTITITEYKIAEDDTNNRTEQEILKSDKITTIVEVRKPGTNTDTEPAGFPLQPIQIISSIHDLVAATLPENQDLIQAISPSLSTNNPVNDMWNMLNVTKRIDALEIAIQKLTSMINDVGKEYHKLNRIVEKARKQDDIFDLKDQLDELNRQIYDKSNSVIFSQNDVVGVDPQTVVPPDTETTEQYNQGAVTGLAPAAAAEVTLEPTDITPKDVKRKSKKECDICDDILILKKEVNNLKQGIQTLASVMKSGDVMTALAEKRPCPNSPEKGNHEGAVTFGEEEKRVLLILQRKVERIERSLTICSTRENELETEYAEICEKIDGILNTDSNEDVNGGHTLQSLNDQIEKTSADVIRLTEHNNRFETEIESHLGKLNCLQESLTQLESIKADKAAIDEFLSEKADITTLHNKVPMNQFEAANRMFSGSLTDMRDRVDKLGAELHEILQSALGKIDMKASADEVGKLREYCEEKLRKLQERIKTLAMLNREPEAAGTRSKFLRDVACISCQQDAVMRTEEKCPLSKMGGFVASKSTKPFLTYKLDALRKQMTKLPYSRNMNHFTEVTQNQKMAENVGRTESDCCARYCGGSHTAIGADEYFQRRNLPKLKTKSMKYTADSYVKGNDGTMYKGDKIGCVCRPCKPDKIQENVESKQRAEKPLEQNIDKNTK